jgi:hypothetical protein
VSRSHHKDGTMHSSKRHPGVGRDRCGLAQNPKTAPASAGATDVIVNQAARQRVGLNEGFRSYFGHIDASNRAL